MTDDMATEARAFFRACHTQDVVRRIKARAGEISAQHGDSIARDFLQAAGVRQRTGPMVNGVRQGDPENRLWPHMQEAAE